jgi:AcrR family transcriptional regulator
MTPDPQDTRNRILDVARTFFAEYGYEGTTVRDITVAAEANLAAVGYHFGSKEGLYQEVLVSQVAPLANSIGQVCRSGLPALDKVDAIIHAVFDHIRSRPQMPAIIARELASGREVNRALVDTFRRVLPAVIGVIVEGQKEGAIRAGDPVLIALSIMSQPIYFNLGRKLLAAVAGVEISDPATAERMADHAAAVIRAGIAAAPPAAGRTRAAGRHKGAA